MIIGTEPRLNALLAMIIAALITTKGLLGRDQSLTMITSSLLYIAWEYSLNELMVVGAE
jgi:hypothetical protein